MLDLCLAEIRCWTHARPSHLIRRDQNRLVDPDVLQDHLILYLRSFSPLNQLSFCDASNRHIAIDLGNAERATPTRGLYLATRGGC